MSYSRQILLLICILLFVGLIVAGRFYGIQQAPTSVASSDKKLWSNHSCQECHQQVWQEWETSYHSKAWDDVHVQAAFQHFGFDRKCQTCHAPEPVFVTGLGNEVLLRTANQTSGVNCVSCHLLPDGKSVAALTTIKDAPCRPVATISLSMSQACSDCHTAIYRDWKGSRYDLAGKSCQSCHMKKKADSSDAPDALVSTHLCIGGHDHTLVRSGVKMDATQEKQELIVSITNHATGHNFPGERHNRELILEVIQRKPDGTITLAKQDLIKGVTPFRGETSAEKIQIDETHRSVFEVVEPPVEAEIRLLYKPFVWQSDRDAVVVHEIKLKLEKP